MLQPRSAVVIGITRDVAGIRLGGLRLGGTGVYMPIGAEAAATTVTLRVRGDAEAARHALVDRLAAVDPNMAEVSTLQMIARAEVYLLGIPFWLTLVLGVLEQRAREIGVRMALGATPGSVTSLVLSQSARPVGIGLLLGGSFTAALSAILLATPAAEFIGSTVHLFDPVAYIGGLLWIVAACTCAALIPALRAARIDPMKALRQD
jgi:hypothetical protein